MVYSRTAEELPYLLYMEEIYGIVTKMADFCSLWESYLSSTVKLKARFPQLRYWKNDEMVDFSPLI